jgi:hypothetical protein
MDNITNAQTNTKTCKGLFTTLPVIVLVLSLALPNTYAVPQDPNFGYYCEDDPESLSVTCCWKETDEEGISIDYCQNCNIDTETGDITNDCGEKHPWPFSPPTTEENIVPGVEGGIEQPPTENEPPIRSDNSVSPNDDSSATDDQQPNPSSPITNQRVPAGNVGVLEELEDSSNSKSEDSVSSENQGLFNVVPQNP